MNKGFYKNASTMSPFQFDKIYPNRKTMDKECANDGILIGRYVLIEYNDGDSVEYTNNSEIDLANYEKTYDSTIWQKIYDKENNKEKYVQIASLDTPRPNVAVTPISPQEEPKVNVDYTTSSETYKFELPKAWGFKVKKAETEYSDEVDEDNNKLNIYYNKDAFDKVRFEEVGSFEVYEEGLYYYENIEEIMVEDNTITEDTITENTIAYINRIPEECPDNTVPDKSMGESEQKYYKVKFLKDNEYLWTNITDIINNPEKENLFYTYGATGIWLLNIEQLGDNPEIKNYSFYKMNGNDPTPCDYQDIEEIKADLNNGAVIYYLTYEKLANDTYNQNTIYYKYDNNNETYNVINIISQEQNSPYWEKFSSEYYNLVDVGTLIINNTGEAIKNSDGEIVQHYKLDDNGDIEFKLNGETEKFSKVTFGIWKPYEYYIKYGKLGDINNDGKIDRDDHDLAKSIAIGEETPTSLQKIVADINRDGEITPIDSFYIGLYANGTITEWPYKLEDFPYEEYNGDIYGLSLEQEKGDGPYYKKVFTSKNNKVENKISLEAIDTNNDGSEDTKVLSLILPGLGNAAANTYDLLYGKDRNSFIYSSIEENEEIYNNGGNPLYNVDEKSVVGLMNKVYDLIGHMKVIDFPNGDLSNGTVIIPGADNNNITLGNYDDLSKTLFKKDDKYYLIIKYKDNEDNVVYEAKEFNEKSLYYLIAEMEYLVSGSYESIFDALDDELIIYGTGIIQVEKAVDEQTGKEKKLEYQVEHKTSLNPDAGIIAAVSDIEHDNYSIKFNEYVIDEYGHFSNPISSDANIIYMPAAFTNGTIPKIDGQNINNAVIPIGSIWYDTSIQLNTPEIKLINQLDTPEIELINQLDTPIIEIEKEE